MHRLLQFCFPVPLLFVAGCVTTIANPESLNNEEQSNALVETYASALKAARLEFDAQLPTPGRARAEAAPNTKFGNSVIPYYVSSGIGLVNEYCDRFLAKLDDGDRSIDFSQREFNVISAFGTTALGIAKATAATVSGYGAATATTNAMVDTYKGSFLISVSAKKIRDQLKGLMREFAITLKQDAPNMDFPTAYSSLKDYADLCRYTSLKDMVDRSVAQLTAVPTPPAGNGTPAPAAAKPAPVPPPVSTPPAPVPAPAPGTAPAPVPAPGAAAAPSPAAAREPATSSDKLNAPLDTRFILIPKKLQ